jgi:hypothetical protein
MFFWNKICGFILLFLSICGISSAQSFPEFQSSAPIFLVKNNPVSDSLSIVSVKKRAFTTAFTEQIVPVNFSVCNYGFFCKKELIIEKAIQIPLRIRLGSLQQCNYYEGKP